MTNRPIYSDDEPVIGFEPEPAQGFDDSPLIGDGAVPASDGYAAAATEYQTARYYPEDDLRLSIGHQLTGGRHAGQFEAEWGLDSGGGGPLSLFASGLVTEAADAGVMAGFRVYFGESEKPLIQRDREDDSSLVGNLGSIVASLNAVYIVDTKTLPIAGAVEYDCAGLYGNQCGAAIPDWRHSMRLSWLFPGDIQASLQWRYIDSVTHEQNSNEPALQGDPVDFGGRLSSRSYFDLAGTWDITDQYSVRLGINNLMDKDPPLVDTQWSGPGTPNTFGPYDTLGRLVFFAVTGKF